MKYRICAVLCALLLVAGVTLAQGVVRENYAEVKKPSASSLEAGAPTFLTALTDLDGSDSTTWDPTTALTGRSFPTKGDPTLEVTLRFSAASATACVVVGRRDREGNFQGIATIQTATALDGTSTVYDGTGYYSDPLYFPLLGWSKYEIRVYDVSGSNTVSLKPVTVGATGAAAE